MEYNEENWKSCLEYLGFTEQKNPNGIDCYNVYDDRRHPMWEYETVEKKKRLYDFFSGMVYMKLRMELR